MCNCMGYERVSNFHIETAHHLQVLWFSHLQIRLGDRNLNNSHPCWGQSTTCQSFPCINVKIENGMVEFISQSNNMLVCGWNMFWKNNK